MYEKMLAAKYYFDAIANLAIILTSYNVAWFLTGLGAGLIALLAASHPAFRKVWEPSQPSNGAASISTLMSRRRIMLVYSIITLILGGSLLDAVRDTEHWPWSNYPMYSDLETGNTFSDYRLYGVPRNNLTSEISLFSDSRYIQPFSEARLSTVLAGMIGKPDLEKGLLDFLSRYESLRREGRHNGPPLKSVRLYKVFWTVDPWGKTIEHPDRKEFILQVQSPADGKLP